MYLILAIGVLIPLVIIVLIRYWWLYRPKRNYVIYGKIIPVLGRRDGVHVYDVGEIQRIISGERLGSNWKSAVTDIEPILRGAVPKFDVLDVSTTGDVVDFLLKFQETNLPLRDLIVNAFIEKNIDFPVSDEYYLAGFRNVEFN